MVFNNAEEFRHDLTESRQEGKTEQGAGIDHVATSNKYIRDQVKYPGFK